MKILILANNDIGLYKFRKELIEELIIRNYEVYISLPDGDFVEALKTLGCKYIKTDIARHGTNPIQDLGLLNFYKKIIRQIQPDMVLTYTIKPNIYGGLACASSDTPYLTNITGLGTAVETKGLLQFITMTVYRKALRKADTVFFQNRENENFFLKHKLVLGKHKLIPGSGVNLSYYVPLPYPKSDTIEFVFIARIMKEKGIDQYLQAAEEIKRKYPKTKFHICGFCEENYEQVLQRFQENGTIIYHGVVADMKEIYKQIHCTVHPTYYPEGLSNVLLESAASARPIITTDRSGCREVIEDGVNGFICKQKDSNDLTMKIENFLQLTWEEKRQMGLAGRTKVEQEFDRNIIVNAYLQKIKEEGIEREALLVGEIRGL